MRHRDLVWLGRAFATTLGLWIGLPALATAQQATVSGQVTDAATTRPINSARVRVVGTTISVMTDADGRFAIQNLPPGTHEVRVQLVGYSSVTRRINATAGQSITLELQLRQAVISMDEVVVTGTPGLGSRRKELGNTVAQVSIQQIEHAPITSVGDVLQGRTTGLTIMDNSGQAGAGRVIRLRGIKSVTQGNTPLIYLDGVRISNRPFDSVGEASQTGSPLNDVNPQDIERVEIIKGAAATTLYGTEASSGVIQIFTKRGSQGRPVWSLQFEQGVNQMGHVGPRSDSTGLNMNDCRHEPGCPYFADNNADGVPDSSQIGWFRLGHLHRYTASVRGGVGNMSYFMSGVWGNEEGVVAPQFTRDWGLRGNFGFTPSDDLTFNFNNFYAYRRTRWFPDGNNAEGLTINVIRGTAGYTPGNDDGVINDMLVYSNTQHFTTAATVSWTPMTGMTHRVTGGLDFAYADNETTWPFGYWNEPTGQRLNEKQENRTMSLDYAGTWEARLGSSATSSFSWGGQLFNETRYGLDGFGEDFPAALDPTISTAASTDSDESRVNVTNGGFFLQETVGINDRLFIIGGLRVDGHSTFGQDFGLAPYPKLSLAYNLSDHAFWPDWWEQMKIRAAYGESGKAPGVFDAEKTWASIAADEAQPAVTPDNLGNPALGPERTREIEAGFEGTAFDSRLAMDVTYYTQQTYDALVSVGQIPSNGFIGTQLENVGDLKNWGFESQVTLSVLRGSSATWDVGLRYSFNKSEAIDLGDVDSIGGGNQRIVVGLPVPAYFKDSIINGSEVGVDPIFETMFVGPTYPRHQWGISSTFTLGRLTVDALGEAQLGQWLASGTAWQNARRGVWPLCKHVNQAIAARDDPVNPDPSLYNSLTAYDRGRCEQRYLDASSLIWINRADFFKLRQVALSYQLPSSILPFGIRSAAFRVQGRNLFRITDFPGLDPEAIEDGSYDNLNRSEYYNLPPARAFLASLKIEF